MINDPTYPISGWRLLGALAFIVQGVSLALLFYFKMRKL